MTKEQRKNLVTEKRQLETDLKTEISISKEIRLLEIKVLLGLTTYEIANRIQIQDEYTC